MVPYLKHYTLPLLPYERQLIEAAGITEEEYRYFVTQVVNTAQVRPAEYDHIPDIVAAMIPAAVAKSVALQAALTSAAVSLAIGVALTAVSYLLTPKPRMPSAADNRVRQRQLASRTGQDAFAATSGFDSIAQLASYAEPIPILFGRYTGTTGGMVIAPKLVWSRCFSWGQEQSVKLMFVVGEEGVEGAADAARIDKPDLAGIFLGTAPLDSAFTHQFAFYWRSYTSGTTPTSRIKGNNLRYGTRGTRDSGDPEATGNDVDIFQAPLIGGNSTEAFCMTYSPASNAQFGVYTPIHNGTDFRVNWRTVPIPQLEGVDDDPKDSILLERIKVAGQYGFRYNDNVGRKRIRAQGQIGTGRGYSRYMGIVKHNDYEIPSNSASFTADRTIAVGDTCVFRISGSKVRRDLYKMEGLAKNVNVDDINNELNTQRSAADQILQLGETIQIGYNAWRVTGRTQAIWQPNTTQDITLKCIEVYGGTKHRKIGLVKPSILQTDSFVIDYNIDTRVGTAVPIAFYPLTRSQVATIRTTRICDAVEFGIRSQVWNRANGLCNFASLPNPEQLLRAEGQKVSLNSGQMSLYFKRTSAFSLQLRKVGLKEDGSAYAWDDIGITFCVTGDQPVDQYNYIRVTPNTTAERTLYEYRFIPRSGADILRNFNDTTDLLWQLDARQTSDNTSVLSRTVNNNYGTFIISAVGQIKTVGNFVYNEEMATGPDINPGPQQQTNIPSELAHSNWVPPNYQDDTELQKRLRYAYHWEIFDGYNDSAIGTTVSVNKTFTSNGRSITLNITGQMVYAGAAYQSVFITKRWEVTAVPTVVSATGTWTLNEIFEARQTLSANNIFKTNAGLPDLPVGSKIARALAVKSLKNGPVVDPSFSADRVFEAGSQAADVSFYSSLLQKSNDTQPEHTISYVNEIIDNSVVADYKNMVTAGLALKASRTYTSLDQVRVWKDDGIPVRRFHPADSFSIGPSNLLCDLIYYLLTDKTAGAGASISPSQVNYPGVRIATFTTAAVNTSANTITLPAGLSISLNTELFFHCINPVTEQITSGTLPLPLVPASGYYVKEYNAQTGVTKLAINAAAATPALDLTTQGILSSGNVFAVYMMQQSDFARTARFLRTNKLFFDGAITDAANIREYITQIAPFFLCNFVVRDGLFSITPALPTKQFGGISDGAISVKNIFTGGNIVEGSFAVDYLNSEERNNIQAMLRYRTGLKNQLPEERNLVVRWNTTGSTTDKLESFDMTEYCTSRDHALLVGKFLLSVRRRITHSVRFKTTPVGLSLAPGDYIRVVTQASPYSSANNGVISDTGVVTPVTPLANGSYAITYYTPESEGILNGVLIVNNNTTTQKNLFGAIFTIQTNTTSTNTYLVEQLTLDEDGLVEISASEFPTDSGYRSLIALDVLSTTAFVTEE